MNVLVIDIGGTHVKILATGQKEHREFVSGPKLTAAMMAAGVRNLAKDWKYDAVSIGYPGPVCHNRPIAEPHNLGKGWVAFDYRSAFKRPVKVINDAAMQALGSYKTRPDAVSRTGHRPRFGHDCGGLLEPMELGHLPYKKATYEDYQTTHPTRRRWKGITKMKASPAWKATTKDPKTASSEIVRR
jgi:polyphosphate glucokinase